jgi:hypothetical protein
MGWGSTYGGRMNQGFAPGPGIVLGSNEDKKEEGVR